MARILSSILICDICLTTAAIASNCLTRPETSDGSTPLPAAIRRRREMSISVRVVALGRGHAVDDSLDPLDLAVGVEVEASIWSSALIEAGDHLDQVAHRTHLLHRGRSACGSRRGRTSLSPFSLVGDWLRPGRRPTARPRPGRRCRPCRAFGRRVVAGRRLGACRVFRPCRRT